MSSIRREQLRNGAWPWSAELQRAEHVQAFQAQATAAVSSWWCCCVGCCTFPMDERPGLICSLR